MKTLKRGVGIFLSIALAITATVSDFPVQLFTISAAAADTSVDTLEGLVNAVNGTQSGETKTITLTQAITIDSSITLGSDTNKNIKIMRGADVKGDLFTVTDSGVELTLQNITIDGGDKDGVADVIGSLVYVKNGGKLIMNAGAILQNNNNTRNGAGGTGGVHVDAGEFEMNGGTIQDNTNSGNVNGGGGVYVSGSGNTFTMSGGTISGNTSSTYGGGVYVSGGTFTMSNGTISGNTAINGGGVYVSGGTFTMSGGTISDNEASRNGGGVYIGSGGTFTMSDGTISGNETTDNITGFGFGGGVYVSGGTFTMSGGEISENTVKNSGGGVYLIGSTFTMDDGTISGNTATNSGGGVCVYSNSTFTMRSGTIGANAATNGGGVNVNGSTFEMSGGEISGNETTDNSPYFGFGGGVYVSFNGTFTMSDGTIINNKAGSSGGGVYANNTITLGGTAVIKNNTKGANENNVYLASSKYITLGTPATGMEVWVQTVTTDGVFVNTGATEGHAQYFKSDDTTKQVQYSDNKLLLLDKPAVSISGTAKYGQKLTAVTKGLTSPTYQWKRDGTDISGATNNTYTLTADDVGKAITVSVSASEGTLTSAPTANVAAAPINNNPPAPPLPPPTTPTNGNNTPTTTTDKDKPTTTTDKDKPTTTTDKDGNKTTTVTETVKNDKGQTVTKTTETIKPADSKNEITIETSKTGKTETKEASIEVKDVKGTLNSKTGVSTVKTDISEAVALAAKAAGTDDAKIEVTLNDAALLKRINNEKVEEVRIVVEGAQSENVDVQVSPEAINKAKELGKDVMLTLKDEDGKSTVIWKIKSDGAPETAPVSLSVGASTAAENKNVSKALEKSAAADAENAVVLSFGQNLPKAADVAVKVTSLVPDAEIKPGDRVYIYKFNPKTGEFEETLQGSAKVSSSGNVTIKNAESENYVILTKPLESKLVKPITKQAKTSLSKKDVKVGNKSKINTSYPQGIDVVKTFDKDSKNLQVKVTYSSSNTKVATVSSSGTVTYVGKGTTTITIRREYSNGKKTKASITITV